MVPRELLHSALGLGSTETLFPWQEKLLERFLEGKVPGAIDLPTGVGKTSVMAIWLVARACGAPLPRRLAYVVDRRTVVDQATEVAVALREWLEHRPELKKALGIDERPLPVSTLRGRYVDNREWLEDPSASAIIVGTVDMIGSRLLFEGYGVSRKMRPYHAALLGVDTLLVLDEAHLVPPFHHLLNALATDRVFRPQDSLDAYVPRFHLIALSATGGDTGADAFGLSPEDFHHPTLRKRLNASKSLRTQTIDNENNLAEELAQQAWRLVEDSEHPVRVVVYSDRRETAQNAKHVIEKLAKSAKKNNASAAAVETELLIGGRRIFEREYAKKRLEELGFVAGRAEDRTRPAVLFATSAGEVGVDLNADHMVCDLVAWERMVQRLGRVHRRGEPAEHVAKVVVLIGPAPKPRKKVLEAMDKQNKKKKLKKDDKKALEQHEKRVRAQESRRKALEQLPRLQDGCFDASVRALFELKERAKTDLELKRTLTEATTPEPLRPALTLASVQAWSLTALQRHPGRPAIQPWLRGWTEEPPQTAVVWRTYLPTRKAGPMPTAREIQAYFEAAPPHTSELLEDETHRVANWILVRARKIGEQPPGERSPAQAAPLADDDLLAIVLDADGSLRKRYTLRDLTSVHDVDEFRSALNGATLIVDARIGGLKDGLLDEETSEPPATADGSDWLGEGGVGFRVRSLKAGESAAPDPNWRERFRFATELSEDGEPIQWLFVDKWRHNAATEDDRSTGGAQSLEQHQLRVEQMARRLARALGLSQPYEDVLARAALLHDEGKRAQRWQRAFNAPKDGVYAKTEGPINLALLDGYRHELGSLIRAEGVPCVRNLPQDQRDLLLHLIAAHHGFARPTIETRGCEEAPPSLLDDIVTQIALRFARLNARWGPWGLAWWEALLRAADQLASR